MKFTVANLDELVGLEGFLKEDVEKSQMRVIINWSEVDKDGKVVTRTEYPEGVSASDQD